jgi:hypothetical protein
LFLRLGRRKKVVVVDTVCVVVVVAYTPWSPRLPSDLEDSESLVIGKAKEEFELSPYAGGALSPWNLSGPSNVIRDSRALRLVNPDSPVFWPAFMSDRDRFDGLGESDSGISGALWRRGSVNVDFFFGAVSKLSVGAVVMIDGAAPLISIYGERA